MREANYHEIIPGLFLGRRLLSHEAKQLLNNQQVAVLDLTAEISELSMLRNQPYFCIPLLDATPPTPEQLVEACKWIEAQKENGAVYVHCVAGHGRSATVLAAYLIWIKSAEDIATALKIIRSSRPGISLSSEQHQSLESFSRGGQIPT